MHTLVVLALPYLQFYVMPLCLSGPVLSPHVLPRRPRTLTLAPQAEGNTSRVCGLRARAWRPTRHGAAHASRAGRAPARQRARPPATQSCCPPWSPRPPPARRALLGQRPSHLHLTVGRALAWVSAPCLRVPWSRTAQAAAARCGACGGRGGSDGTGAELGGRAFMGRCGCARYTSARACTPKPPCWLTLLHTRRGEGRDSWPGRARGAVCTDPAAAGPCMGRQPGSQQAAGRL